MRLKGSAVGMIALAAALFFTAPVTASAATDQPSSPAATSATCSESSGAGISTRAADDCTNIGSVFDWEFVEVHDGVYLLKRKGTNDCLTTNGDDLFRAPCRSSTTPQLWRDVTDNVGARTFVNVAHPEVCVYAYVAP
ncbi:hypothetical protein ACQPYE_12060 [Actinosynnema sp. CA-299493]